MLIFSQTTWYPFYYMHTSAPRNADSAAAATSKSPTQWPGVTTIDSPTAEYRVVVAVMHDNPVIVYCSSVGI